MYEDTDVCTQLDITMLKALWDAEWKSGEHESEIWHFVEL